MAAMPAREGALLLWNDSALSSDPVASLVLKADYMGVFSSSVGQSLLAIPASVTTFDALVAHLASRAATVSAASADDAWNVLLVAVSFLNAFSQINWTGPELPLSPSDVFGIDVSGMNVASLASLASDSEEAYHLTDRPIFLSASLAILQAMAPLPSLPWWKARALFTQQRILEDRSATLLEQITACHNAISLPTDVSANITADVTDTSADVTKVPFFILFYVLLTDHRPTPTRTTSTVRTL